MAHHIRRPPQPLGVPAQPRNRVQSEGPLEDEEHHDFDQYRAYKYSPIESHQMRLLTLRGGRPQEPILGRLQTFDFSDTQEQQNIYNTLSYSCKFWHLELLNLSLSMLIKFVDPLVRN
jgi:hypothetical protein